MNIKEQAKKTAIKIDLLSYRERVLILLVSLSLIYFSWRSLVVDSLENFKQQASGNASKLQQQISSLQGQITEISGSLSLDPVVRLQEKITKTQQENADLQAKLTKMTEKLIPPKEMTSLLRNILDNHKDLVVMKVENVPAVPVFSTSKSKDDDEDDEKSAKEALARFQVYRHSLEIVVSGTFFQLRDFLEEAEKLPWTVLWDELEYSVTNYPMATTRLVIQTLSLNASWLSTS